jgi:hypothetical protein
VGMNPPRSAAAASARPVLFMRVISAFICVPLKGALYPERSRGAAPDTTRGESVAPRQRSGRVREAS